jgi:hypothetical protein
MRSFLFLAFFSYSAIQAMASRRKDGLKKSEDTCLCHTGTSYSASSLLKKLKGKRICFKITDVSTDSSTTAEDSSDSKAGYHRENVRSVARKASEAPAQGHDDLYIKEAEPFLADSSALAESADVDSSDTSFDELVGEAEDRSTSKSPEPRRLDNDITEKTNDEINVCITEDVEEEVFSETNPNVELECEHELKLESGCELEIEPESELEVEPESEIEVEIESKHEYGLESESEHGLEPKCNGFEVEPESEHEEPKIDQAVVEHMKNQDWFKKLETWKQLFYIETLEMLEKKEWWRKNSTERKIKNLKIYEEAEMADVWKQCGTEGRVEYMKERVAMKVSAEELEKKVEERVRNLQFLDERM